MLSARHVVVLGLIAIGAFLASAPIRADFCTYDPGTLNGDTDGDGHVDCDDNCPLQPNDQADMDADGVGDVCDCGLRVAPGNYSSLATAIRNASNGCAIVVPAGHYRSFVIAGQTEPVVFRRSVSLLGAGADITVIDRDGGSGPVLSLGGGTPAFIGGVTIRGGDVGVYAGGSTIGGDYTVTDVILSDNDQGMSVEAGFGDYEIYYGRAIVSLSNSTFRANGTGIVVAGGAIGGLLLARDSRIEQSTGPGVIAQGSARPGGGGQARFERCTIDGNGGGGIIAGAGDAEVIFTDGTISGNTSEQSGGGVRIEGAYADGGPHVSLSRSTVSGNASQGDGGGLFNGSGSLYYQPYPYGGELSLSNVTISGNTAAGAGGGLYNAWSVETSTLSHVTCQNCTITANHAATGGGVAFAGPDPGQADFASSAVAGNTATESPECSGQLKSNGYNLIQDEAGCTITGDTTGNVLGVYAGLGPLADNGGPTLTHLPGTPMIDRVPSALCPDTDQRGVTRPLGAACEIGAVEYECAGGPDSDGDGAEDRCDNCPEAHDTDQLDTDLDGIGDACDDCPGVVDPSQSDSDGDGVGDACDACPSAPNDDADTDGVCDDLDNCPSFPNSDQSDGDADRFGDACDNCPGRFNEWQTDQDADGLGDPCDPCPWPAGIDSDGDGYCDDADNCPEIVNPDQTDTDGDSVGDLCDSCPSKANAAQHDLDRDQWAASATASSEWSSTDWSAAQATGSPDSAVACDELPTNWSPAAGDATPEWLELTYAGPVQAGSVIVHESFLSSFVAAIELIDTAGNVHALPSETDTTSCGGTLVRQFDISPDAVSRVRLVTQVDGWEEIDAVQLVSSVPEGAGDACDTCPDLFDPDQIDGDGDGRGDPCDCAPTDPAVRTPDEVELRVTKITPEGVMRLEWDWPVGTDGVHVTRGLTRDLPLGDYGNCIATDFTARLFYDWYVPPAGQCLTYLVHAESAACGVGSLGRMSNGAERVNTNLARCP